MAIAGAYPVTLAVDYPERQSRWKTLLRLFLAIPVLLFFMVLSGATWPRFWSDGRVTTYSAGVAGGVVLAIWVTIVLRARIPRWLFDFQVALLRWEIRALSYFALLTDTYPPFEGDYPIRLEVQYPERLARWKVLIWKTITSIPHVVVLVFLSIGAFFAVIIAWFAILVAGRFPQGLHGYVAGVIRWGMRVQAYLLSLTDEYPPFSLAADAGPGGRDSYVISSILGVLATGGVIAGIVVLAIIAGGEKVARVSYADLLAGEMRPADTRITVDSVTVELTGATDPADDLVSFLAPQPGYRFVLLELSIENGRGRDLPIRESDFRLEDEEGDGDDAYLVLVGGRIPRVDIAEHRSADTELIFELPNEVDPAELRYNSGFGFSKTIVYEFQ
jgi:hypothetical protein